jgi:hypothetical protein
MTANPVLSVTAPPESNIIFHAGQSEMLKVTEDGFYIRGVKIDQDAKEAEKVYNAFTSWLTWAALTRNY